MHRLPHESRRVPRVWRRETMKSVTAMVTTAACVAALSLGAAAAQEPNTDKTTYVTFSAPVALPGVTLPPGDYMFKLLNSQVNRNIVQIFNHDRSKLFATVVAIPAQRIEVNGQEFAYPVKQAQELADTNHEAVVGITPTGGDPSGAKGGEINRVQPRGDAKKKHPKTP